MLTCETIKATAAMTTTTITEVTTTTTKKATVNIIGSITYRTRTATTASTAISFGNTDTVFTSITNINITGIGITKTGIGSTIDFVEVTHRGNNAITNEEVVVDLAFTIGGATIGIMTGFLLITGLFLYFRNVRW